MENLGFKRSKTFHVSRWAGKILSSFFWLRIILSIETVENLGTSRPKAFDVPKWAGKILSSFFFIKILIFN